VEAFLAEFRNREASNPEPPGTFGHALYALGGTRLQAEVAQGVPQRIREGGDPDLADRMERGHGRSQS
jgi:hypothetical protein